MSQTRLKILTYNIHKGFNITNRKYVLPRIREIIQTTGADLAFLQEIHGEHSVQWASTLDLPDATQYEYLADQMWPHFAYGKNAIYDSGHHGNAILSKYPFLQWENLNVSLLKRASRSLLHGVFEVIPGSTPIHVICVHLDQIQMLRLGQLKRLVQRIGDSVPDNSPLIVAGDFNDWRGRASRFLLAEAGLQEVFQTLHGHHAMTYPSGWPFLPLDRIYFRHINLLNCQSISGRPWHTVSDHMPLYAEFELQ